MLRSPSDLSNGATTLLLLLYFICVSKLLLFFFFLLFAVEFSMTVPRHAGSWMFGVRSQAAVGKWIMIA
jgi:hypothetical protein